MRISEQFIASLLARVDLVELISKKVYLRNVGANFVGLCPFHQEKTPSFTVNQSKQFFHCFGCQQHGDAIKFIMLLEHKDFLSTVKDLAEQYGLNLERDQNIRTVDPIVDLIHQILAIAVEYYHQNLLQNHLLAKQALNYLTERNIELATIRHFKIGVAANAWHALYNHYRQLISSGKLTLNHDLNDLLQQAGLVAEKSGNFYDRFRGRIIFPIKNKFGKFIGLGGRALGEHSPKYLNSPETIVFNKSQELYGIFEVTSTLKQLNNLIVVEGYVDFLTLFQAKIYNVVATLGTAINEYHLQAMLKITAEIIFCFDGDLAGSKASIRAMELAFKVLAQQTTSKINFKFIMLPNGMDPDLFIRTKGIDPFLQLINNAQVLSEFFFNWLIQKYPGNSIENLNKLAQEAKGYINRLPDLLLQNLWYEKLARILDLDSKLLKDPIVGGMVPTTTKKKVLSNVVRNKTKQIKPNSIVAKAIAILIYSPNLLSLCKDLDEYNFSQLNLPEEFQLFYRFIEILNNLVVTNHMLLVDPKSIIDHVVNHLDLAYAQKLLQLDPSKIIVTIPNLGMEQELIGAVKYIKKFLLGLVLDELLILSKERSLTFEEKNRLQQILQSISLINQYS